MFKKWSLKCLHYQQFHHRQIFISRCWFRWKTKTFAWRITWRNWNSCRYLKGDKMRGVLRLTYFTYKRLFAGTVETVKVGLHVISPIQIQAGRTSGIVVETGIDACPGWKARFVSSLGYLFVVIDPVPRIEFRSKLPTQPYVTNFLNIHKKKVTLLC